MKLLSFTAFLALSAQTSAVEESLNWPNVFNEHNVKNLSSKTECKVSQIHAMPLPGEPEIKPTYSCTTDDGIPHIFDEDASPLFGPDFRVGSRVSISSLAFSGEDGSISVQQAMMPGALSVSSIQDEGIEAMTTGTKKVLIVLVKSNSYAPSQSAWQMAQDTFFDENNLKKRYDECSNGQLIFQPATGTNVNNGVITVSTSQNLNGISYSSCGNIALNAGKVQNVSRDYTMIVCPDAANFQGAAALGQMPGSITWYLSSYASVPIVQMHELGHNLGHHHSGKDGVTYADPTCNMGNQGSWSDEGSAFCFNGAKMFAEGWYSNYHMTIDPKSNSYDGTLVGINAVADGVIGNNQDVILKISSSGETDIYVMFMRQTGALASIPNYGNKVVITSQGSSFYTTSSFEGALSSGQTYTQSSWSNTGSLKIQVCSLNASGTGSARILVYATGRETLSCSGSPATNSPTQSDDNCGSISARNVCQKECGCQWKKGACSKTNLGLWECSTIVGNKNQCKKQGHCKWKNDVGKCKTRFICKGQM